MRIRSHQRSAASIVEFGIIGSVTILILLGTIVGGLGIFRYQLVARLARDASRWASVHGTQYAQDTGNPAATAYDVYDKSIFPYATGLLDLSKLSYSVTWNTSNSPYRATTVNGQQVNVANTVTVSVSYNWLPGFFLGGITLSSSSITPMNY